MKEDYLKKLRLCGLFGIGKFLSYLAGVLFALLYVIVPFTAEAAEVNAEQSRRVRVGWYNSEHFQEGDAELTRKSGYSYEYLQNIANYAGWEYEYTGWMVRTI